MSKILILYYSFEGSTKKVAELISNTIDAKMEAVMPVNELKSKGFSKYIRGGSQVVMGKKPELVPLQENLDEYDTILIGSPIWAGTFAPPIKTLLEEGSIKGKKIGYFYCHEGGASKAVEKARKSIEKENTFLSAIGCNNVSKNLKELEPKIIHWAKKIVEK